MFLMVLCAICMLIGTSTLFFDAEWLHIIGGCLYFLGPVIVIFGIPLSVGLSDENSDDSDVSGLNTAHSEEAANK